MLNTDFEIFFDLDLDANGKSVCKLDNTCPEKETCGKHGVCPQAATYDLGKQYIEVSSNHTKITNTELNLNEANSQKQPKMTDHVPCTSTNMYFEDDWPLATKP